MPAPRLTLSHSAPAPPLRLLTVFASHEAGRRLVSVPRAVQTAQGACLLAVTADTHTDLLVVPAGPMSGALTTDAAIAAVRVPRAAGEPLELDRIGGHRLDADAAALRFLLETLSPDTTP